ncbi:UNVERIFIED_CONTAM: hypothetical protein GTU68_046188 [Idotea baltica]|nr:hypothetical protein [Idotea baltica]
MKLRIKLTPNASKNEILGWEQPNADEPRYLRVRVTDRAVGGRANQAAIKFLAKRLGIPRSRIILIAGHISRFKTFEVPDENPLLPNSCSRPSTVRRKKPRAYPANKLIDAR